MGMAKNDVGLACNGRRLDRRVGRTLAVSHDDDPLAAEFVAGLER